MARMESGIVASRKRTRSSHVSSIWRRIVHGTGLGELHLNAQGAAPEDAAFMADCGFDSLTDYNTTPETMPPDETAALRARGVWEIDYRNCFPTVRRRWQEMSSRSLTS